MYVVGPEISIDDEFVWNGESYVANGTWGGQEWGLSDEGPFTLSEEYNELVLVGCGINVELMIIPGLWGGEEIINTCSSICSERSSRLDHECQQLPSSRRCQKCSGIGCCQVPIPFGKVSYTVWLTTLEKSSSFFEYIFISEEGWFHPYNMSRSPSWSAIPVLLAWAIVSNVLRDDPRDGNATCPKDLGSTACHSSYSTCRNHPHGNHTASYTCSCWDGYQGNPYLPDGCRGTRMIQIFFLFLSRTTRSIILSLKK